MRKASSRQRWHHAARSEIDVRIQHDVVSAAAVLWRQPHLDTGFSKRSGIRLMRHKVSAMAIQGEVDLLTNDDICG